MDIVEEGDSNEEEAAENKNYENKDNRIYP